MADNDNGLTPKQEAFALAYVETGSGAEAYRRAYDVKAATQHSTIWEAASRLLASHKVRARVALLQEQAAKLSLFTVAAAAREYDEARGVAKKVRNPSAMVAATTGKVKLFGLGAPDKTELTGKDGGPIETRDVSPVDLARKIAFVLTQATEMKDG